MKMVIDTEKAIAVLTSIKETHEYWAAVAESPAGIAVHEIHAISSDPVARSEWSAAEVVRINEALDDLRMPALPSFAMLGKDRD